jgi:hypothetical protein
MGNSDLILIAVLLLLLVSFWIRFRGRYPDDQRDDASLDRKRSDYDNGDSGGGDGGGD